MASSLSGNNQEGVAETPHSEQEVISPDTAVVLIHPPYSLAMFSKPPAEVPQRRQIDSETISQANEGVACGGIRFVTPTRRDKSKGPPVR